MLNICGDVKMNYYLVGAVVGAIGVLLGLYSTNWISYWGILLTILSFMLSVGCIVIDLDNYEKLSDTK